MSGALSVTVGLLKRSRGGHNNLHSLLGVVNIVTTNSMTLPCTLPTVCAEHGENTFSHSYRDSVAWEFVDTHSID